VATLLLLLLRQHHRRRRRSAAAAGNWRHGGFLVFDFCSGGDSEILLSIYMHTEGLIEALGGKKRARYKNDLRFFFLRPSV
jgi:hypothetical protein